MASSSSDQGLIPQANAAQDQDDEVQFLGFVQGVPPVAPVQPNHVNAAQSLVDAANNPDTECIICTNQMCLPTEVPACRHVFCFTCIKAVSLSASAGCPICRGAIDVEVFRRSRQMDLKMKAPGQAEPDLSVRRFVNNVGDELEEVKPDIEILRAQLAAEAARIFWVYAGRNHGHWRYEPRIEQELNDAYDSGEHQEIRIIAMGRNYKVNFANMVQFPEGQPQCARAILRLTAPQFDNLMNQNLINGIAGAPVQRN